MSLFRRFRLWRYRRRMLKRAHPDCVEPRSEVWPYGGRCQGKNENHACCNRCGAVTCQRRLRLDERTLRRRVVALCSECWEATEHRQNGLQRERTHKDWQEVTTPVNKAAVIPDVMTDYLGASRAAIRAFQESGATRATVPDLPAGTLQQVIQTLGLAKEIFAEQRANTTVLRRAES